MIRHVPGPCPGCGAGELYAVLSGTQAARECLSCGWISVPGTRNAEAAGARP